MTSSTYESATAAGAGALLASPDGAAVWQVSDWSSGTRAVYGRAMIDGRPGEYGRLPADLVPAVAGLAYVDIDGRKRCLLIKPRRIELTRAEGPAALCGKRQEFLTYSAANWQLLRNSRTAPTGGAYDKHDFRVTFADGAEYSGRFDCHHTEYYGATGPRLQEHIRGYLEWLTGEAAAGCGWISGEMREGAAAMLATHDVGQRPPYLPDDDASPIVRDYRTQPLTADELRAPAAKI